MVNAVIRGILQEVKMKCPLDSLSFGPANQEVDLDMSAEDDWMTYVDEISGKDWNAALVRQEELEYADRYGIWDEVPTQECWDQTKAAPISTHGSTRIRAMKRAQVTDPALLYKKFAPVQLRRCLQPRHHLRA